LKKTLFEPFVWERSSSAKHAPKANKPVVISFAALHQWFRIDPALAIQLNHVSEEDPKSVVVRKKIRIDLVWQQEGDIVILLNLFGLDIQRSSCLSRRHARLPFLMIEIMRQPNLIWVELG